MLTSATADIDDCMKQICALYKAGSELIRLAVTSGRDLEAVGEIRRRMQEEGISAPLVADVHFSPRLAIDACELFEKVRINPGNYTDVSKNTNKKHSPGFEEGRERLKEAIAPLVGSLRKFGRALRIGVNHGSLSTRMIERYGNSPRGMVESALEMEKLLEEQEFDQFVISLKSSNPIIAQKAYRLLAARQPDSGATPFHLGVTEAGNGVMGRMNGLVGIGTLLRDGLGDTIRVSLAEDSVNEILYAHKLLQSLETLRESRHHDSSVWSRKLDHQRVRNESLLGDNIEIGNASPLKIGTAQKSECFGTAAQLEPDFPFETDGDSIRSDRLAKPLFLSSNIANVNRADMSRHSAILLDTDSLLFDLRRHYKRQEQSNTASPPVGILLRLESDTDGILPVEMELAAVLGEGLADFLLVPESITAAQTEKLICLLQATRSRTLLPDYIVCPSCGRTLFDLQRTTKKIKAATQHLKGIKIGIMGCIVNGPGEMADADFGFVGSGAGKIDLYVGQKRVQRGIEESKAVGALIRLIKKHNRWIEPNS